MIRYRIRAEIEDVQKLLSATVGNTFFVCDGASSENARTLIESQRASATPLIGNEITSPLGTYGPWLLQLFDSERLAVAVTLMLAEPIGWIFKTARASEEARRFLKRLNFVLLPSGEKVLFRYYDPRVFGAVLSFDDLSVEQYSLLCNRVSLFLIPNETPELQVFHLPEQHQ